MSLKITPLPSLSRNCPLQLCFLPYRRRGTIIQSGIRRRRRRSHGDVGGCRNDDARARRRRSLVPGMLIIWETPIGHT